MNSCPARNRARGFTLLELLVTIAVAAILLAIAIPSYRGVVERNALVASVNDLVGDLNYARSQAVTRGTSVFLCKSSDQTSCTASGNWAQGWIVYAPDAGQDALGDPDQRLRVRGALTGEITITGNNKLATSASFDANGFTSTFGTLTAKADNTKQNTEIIINRTGRIRTEKTSQDKS